MRRLLFLVVLAGMLAVHPALAQNKPSRVQTVQATKATHASQVAAPDALRHDPAATAKPLRDPRPMKGLVSRPGARSVDAFSVARAGSVQGFARSVPVGAVQRVMGAAGKTTPGLLLGGAVRLERAPNETVRWLRGRLGRAGVSSGAGKQAAYTQAALEIAEAYAGVLGLKNPTAELRSMRTTEGELGYVHARFEQVYEGLRVWGRDLYIHFNDEGEAYALNGTYEPTPAGVATQPSLDETTALRAAIDDLRARGRWAPLPEDVADWLDIEAPQTELVLYPDPDRGMRLAYDVTLHPNLLERFTYLIDARTGQILGRIERHCTLHYQPKASAPIRVNGMTRPATGAAKAGAAGFVDATATDLNGVQQNMRVYEHDDQRFYSIWDLDNLNPASQLPNEPDGGAMTIDANSTDLGENVNLTHVTSANNTWNDASSVSAHVNMKIAYDYYKNKHQRNAIDGNDQSMISIIHVTDEGRPMDNAFWNGRVMAYGDGDQAFLPLAGGLDVAGHEITHGVIDNTAGLIYQFQSGALNESFADVFGVMIEPNDFLLGEDIMRANFAALRDLLNPDNPNVLADQPASMSQFQNLNADQDNGGVHINSGIPNRAAALITQLLGIEATEQIYYRALTTYLTRNSQFGDARNALEQSALDLFPGQDEPVNAVRQAFDDVGIFATSGEGGDEGNDLPVQTGGTSFVAFLLDDGSIKLLDVTDFNFVQVLSFNDPGAVARVDNDTGDRSQLTTPLDGETLWFINPDGLLAFIELETGDVSVFPNLFIQQEGDLWNASVSPNGNFVALVSAYNNDPNIYILDRAQSLLCTIPLEPETTQENIENQTIQFPDVISWSPNPQVPRLVFDALNEVDFGTENEISYWSIYEIDFDADDCSANSIFNLVPAQPNDVSVGNITYSKTDPDVVAFNEITDTWDVLVGDFETGRTEAIGFSNFLIDGQNINDAQRPSFSPDDTQLCVSSPAFGVLLFYDLETGDPPPFIDLQQSQGSAPYNPHWFLRGGSGGAGNRAPTADITASATAGAAPLLVTFDASLSSDPDGDALSYSWNFGDGSNGSGASVSHTFAQAGIISVTLTVTDSGGLSDTATIQIDISAPSSTVALRGFDPQQDEQVVLQIQNDNGFIMGTNSFQDQAKAMVFTLPPGVSSAQVTEVNVWFGFKRAASTLDYAIEILDGNATDGPSSSLAREVFPLSGVNADEDVNSDEDPTSHVLAQPVPVGPSFIVAVDFGNYGEDDFISAGLVSSALVGSRVAEVWEKWSNGTWNNLSESWDFGGGFGVDGAIPWIEAVVQTGAATPVEDAVELPRALALASNYPNPFNASTTLQLELPTRAEVELHIIDLLGRTVATLVEGPMDAGVHSVRFEAGGLPSGVYLARLRAGSATMTRKMVLVR